MKGIFIGLAALGTAGFAVTKFTAASNNRCTKPKTEAAKATVTTNSKAAAGFAVVELFTSEGCSSCPPADALLAKLEAEKGANVYVLSYHVDYWDRLGWKDAFSKPEWTARQAVYVSQFGLESAYTPQAVVNGSKEFVGSSSGQLHTSIDKNLQQADAETINVQASVADGKINLSYTATPSATNVINIALVQSSATSQVVRGENSGRQLHHVNVVRDLLTLPAKAAAEAAFRLPDGFAAKDYKVIAFVQNKSNLKIVGATETAVQEATQKAL